jgi:phenylacetic acid degradation operon negative regulatory protein
VQPTPKSLILDLLSTLPRGAVPVRALVEAAELFAISENRLRVALTRGLAAGAVERDERGRYRLAAGAGVVSEQIRCWREAADRRRAWTGAWVAVHGRVRRGAGARHARALRFLGFRALEPDLALRPDNLEGGVGDVRRRLERIGLAAGARVFGVSGLDDASERRARELWDTRALRAGYRARIGELEASAARLPRLPRGAAMAESFVLGGQAIGQIVLDPLLPEPLLAAQELDALVAAMRRYDRLGRRAWRGWFGAAVPDELPVGVRAQPAATEAAQAAGGT